MRKGDAFLEKPKQEFYSSKALGEAINANSILVPSNYKLPLNSGINRIIKRIFDILFSTLILILRWFIPILANLIKAGSKRPIFFFKKETKGMGKFLPVLNFVR
ncbi:MAG: hypothetical protein ABI308_06810 [Mucilaginibacter sp.]